MFQTEKRLKDMNRIELKELQKELEQNIEQLKEDLKENGDILSTVIEMLAKMDKIADEHGGECIDEKEEQDDNG